LRMGMSRPINEPKRLTSKGENCVLLWGLIYLQNFKIAPKIYGFL
jgi:hypothetical protein